MTQPSKQKDYFASTLETIAARLSSAQTESVFRGMAILAVGTGAGRLIALGSIPILTRIYSPDEYGVLAVFMSIVLLLAPLLTLRYVLALPLPQNDFLAIHLLALCGIIFLVMSLTVSAAFYFFGSDLLSAISMEVLLPWQPLIVVGVIAMAFYEIMSLWATRRRAYRLIARSQIIQSAIGEALKIGLGLLNATALGLLIGQVVGQTAGFSSLSRILYKDLKRTRSRVRLSRIRLIASYYSDFPFYRFPAQFLLVFSMQAPLLITAAVFDVEATGQFGLATMAMTLPFMLIGQAASRAYYAEIARLGGKNVALIRKLTTAVMSRLALVALPLSTILFFGGDIIFTIAFGEQWSHAGQIASILSIYLVLQFASSPILEVFNIYGGQRIFLQIYGQRAILTVLAFAYGTLTASSLLETVSYFTFALCVHYLIVIARVLHILKVQND